MNIIYNKNTNMEELIKNILRLKNKISNKKKYNNISEEIELIEKILNRLKTEYIYSEIIFLLKRLNDIILKCKNYIDKEHKNKFILKKNNFIYDINQWKKDYFLIITNILLNKKQENITFTNFENKIIIMLFGKYGSKKNDIIKLLLKENVESDIYTTKCIYNDEYFIIDTPFLGGSLYFNKISNEIAADKIRTCVELFPGIINYTIYVKEIGRFDDVDYNICKDIQNILNNIKNKFIIIFIINDDTSKVQYDNELFNIFKNLSKIFYIKDNDEENNDISELKIYLKEQKKHL